MSSEDSALASEDKVSPKMSSAKNSNNNKVTKTIITSPEIYQPVGPYRLVY